MPDRLTDPIPLHPRHGRVIDGEHVSLEWEAPAGAESLRVEVSRNASFEDVACAEELPPDTRGVVLERCFPDEGATFYWRVLARGPGGWSPGERIESFMSGSAGDVALGSDPDADEPVGPVPELFRVAGLQGMAEVTPGRQPAADRAVGGQAEGLEGAEIVTLGLALTVAAGMVLLVLVVVLFFAF